MAHQTLIVPAALTAVSSMGWSPWHHLFLNLGHDPALASILLPYFFSQHVSQFKIVYMLSILLCFSSLEYKVFVDSAFSLILFTAVVSKPDKQQGINAYRYAWGYSDHYNKVSVAIKPVIWILFPSEYKSYVYIIL